MDSDDSIARAQALDAFFDDCASGGEHDMPLIGLLPDSASAAGSTGDDSCMHLTFKQLFILSNGSSAWDL